MRMDGYEVEGGLHDIWRRAETIRPAYFTQICSYISTDNQTRADANRQNYESHSSHPSPDIFGMWIIALGIRSFRPPRLSQLSQLLPASSPPRASDGPRE